MAMDKYEQKIELLAQRIRRLEMESLPAVMPVQEVRELIDDLDLVPMPSTAAEHSAKLTGEAMMSVLESQGYTCRLGEDFVSVDTEEGKIQVNFDRLPLVSVTNGYRFDETPECVTSLREAAHEVIGYWDMVKALVDSAEGHLLIFLDARHEDVSSFQRNIRFYIDQVLGASRYLKDRYHEHERDRMLKGFMTSTKQVLS